MKDTAIFIENLCRTAFTVFGVPPSRFIVVSNRTDAVLARLAVLFVPPSARCLVSLPFETTKISVLGMK